MKAQDLVQASYKAEKELKAEIGDIISKKINQLSLDTGLIIGSINIDLNEVTALNSKGREYNVSSVTIDTSLPSKIAGF